MTAGKGTWATSDIITATGLNSGYDGSGNIKLTAGEKIMDANANEIVEFTQTASAVNNIKIANAATGGNPSIIVSGEDVGLDIEGVTIKNGAVSGITTLAGEGLTISKSTTGTTTALYMTNADATANSIVQISARVSDQDGLLLFKRTANDYGVDFELWLDENTAGTSTKRLSITEAGVANITGSLAVSTGFGCNGATAQTAYASGGAVSDTGNTFGNGTAANYMFTSKTEHDALYTLVNNMRAALVANGIMS